MVAIGKILIVAGKVCEKGSNFAERTGLKRTFPVISDTFTTVSASVKKGMEMAINATEQPILKKITGADVFDEFVGKMKKSGIGILVHLFSDMDFVGMLAKYSTMCSKRIPIPKSGTEFFQLIFEQTTGSTKLLQIISENKDIMAKIPFKPVREAIANAKSNCIFSRTLPEAQNMLDRAFSSGEYTIQKELSSASVGDVYVVKNKDGGSFVLKMLKKGLSREKLELEEKIYLKLLKELVNTPQEFIKYSKIIKGCYSDFIASLSFASEAKNNVLLAKGAKRYGVAPIHRVSDDGSCLIMERAQGIRYDKLTKILSAYKNDPNNFSLRYAEEISRYPWLANPSKVIAELPDIIIRTFDEQFMFLKKGAISVMHGDPHPGNFFIGADKKGRLFPTFIDSGSCVVRNEKQIINDVSFFTDYYLGNTLGIARHFVDLCNVNSPDKAILIQKLAAEFKEKIFQNKNITDIKRVFDNMTAILNENGLKLPDENVIATKAQMQFYSLAHDAARLSGEALNVITILKDLPRAILKMFIYGKRPIANILPTLKYSIHNIDSAVGASYQFSISKL